MATDEDQPGELVPAVLAGALAELCAHVLGVGWAASPLAPALQLGFRAIRAADRRLYLQISEALTVAIDETDGGAPEVERLALADPARTELFRRVVQAAGRSTLEAKIPALGRVLAAGLPDGDTVDEALILAAGLADIEAPHVQLLGLLSTRAEMETDDGMESLGPGWPEAAVRAALPGHNLVISALVSTMERHGLVVEIGKGSFGGGVRWTITDLGRRCLDLLREA